MNNVDQIRGKLSRRELLLGTAVQLVDPLVSEIVVQAGYDFVFLDMEHSALTLQTTVGHLIALRKSSTAAFIRVPWADPVLMKPIIDLDPDGIIVPMVCTAEDAATAVAACKYPPKGVRGFAPCRGVKFGAVSTAEYLQNADDQTLVIVQVEHIKAVENLDAILATPGIDTIMIGPYDLSGSMGILGQITDPKVVAVIEQVVARAVEVGMPVGLAGCPPDALSGWFEKGISWFMLNGDYGLLYASAKTALDDARSIVGQGRKEE